MNDCPRFGKLFGGCRFEARYDDPGLQGFFHGGFAHLKIDGEVQSVEDVLPVKKYVRDICIRCGKTVDRLK